MEDKDEMAKTETYLCTRPQLAAALMDRGFRAEPGRNPFRPELHAWIFDLSPELAEIVAEYFRRIEKPAPRTITEYLREVYGE